MAEFECWLSDRLTALKVDAEVFSSYIRGILEGDEKPDEKIEAIEGILESASTETGDVSGVTREMISMFNQLSVDKNSAEVTLLSSESSEPHKTSLDEKVRTIFSQQTAKTSESAKNKKLLLPCEETTKLKSSILSQYAEVEVAGEAENTRAADSIKTSLDQTTLVGPKERRKGPPVEKDPLLVRNTNAQQVFEAEKLKREKNKQESEAKKAKDKQDRENQKKKDSERKEKEKQRTQKGERRK